MPTELTAPFVFKNEEKRIVYGPVLIPNEKDSDDDVVTPEKIEQVAHKFVEDYGNVDLMHSLNNVGRLVESYILPTDLEVNDKLTVPKGSWMMGVRVTDDDSWKAVKEKKLGGFSIMAMQKTAMKSAEKNDKKDSKRVTLADLGEDWIVNAVSLVDEPAVPKAKFIAIKSKNDNNIDIDSNIVEKAVAGSLESRRMLIDRELEKAFGGYERHPFIHSTLEDSVIFRVHDHNNERKTFQVGYSIDDNGSVEFTEQPQEVRIEENVVPMQAENMLGASKSDTAESNTSSSEGFMAKFMERLGFTNRTSEKAGKAISSSNLKKLRQAKEVIDDLLAIGEKERKEKGKKSKEGAEMNKEDVQKMIDEQMTPINSKLDDVIKSMKDDVKEDIDEDQSSKKSKEDEQQEDGQQETATKSEETDDSSDNEQSYEELYKATLKQLEQAKNKPFSQRLSGQDNMTQKSKEDEQPKRNAFGYKIK